jgi:hypothetical protein
VGSSDREERNRVLGFPVRGSSRARPKADPPARPDADSRAHQEAEPQRVLGFPVDWFASVGPGRLTAVARFTRAFRQRIRHPRTGPRPLGQDEPDPGVHGR